MEKNGVAVKVDWLKGSLEVMLKAAVDSDDPNSGSALKFIDDMVDNVNEWMEAHYGDQ